MNKFNFLFDLPAYQALLNPQRVAGGLWRQGIKEEISSEQLMSLVQIIASHLIKQSVSVSMCGGREMRTREKCEHERCEWYEWADIHFPGSNPIK